MHFTHEEQVAYSGPKAPQERSQLRQAMDKLSNARVRLESAVDALFEKTNEVCKPVAVAMPVASNRVDSGEPMPQRSELTKEIFGEAAELDRQRERLEHLLNSLDL